MFGFFDDGPGGTEGMMKHEIGQIRVLQRHSAHERRLVFRTHAQRHPVIGFDHYSRHSILSFVRSHFALALRGCWFGSA